MEEAPGLVNTYGIATAISAAEQEGSSYLSVHGDPASWLKMVAITTNSSEALLVYFSKYNRDVDSTEASPFIFSKNKKDGVASI